MRNRPTAGQATVEYLAALALIAALFVVAAPAVGAPNLGKIVVVKLRLALCIVAGDVCSTAQAKADGLSPCPLKSDVKGHEASITFRSVEIGRRWVLGITNQSDGSVSVVRTLSGSAGGAGGAGWDFTAGPVQGEFGPSGAARSRVQGAVGWDFPNQAEANKFLEHALVNEFRWKQFPPSWGSLEGGSEFSGGIGASLGAKGASDQYDIFGLSVSAQGAMGAKLARGGAVTVYGRVGGSGALALPFVKGLPNYSAEWTAEYTYDDAGPSQLAFRQSLPSGLREVTDTVARLDLHDPANAAVARSILSAAFPWPPSLIGRVKDVLAYIGEHGTVERTVSAVDDDSWGVGGHVRAGLEVGASGKRINVHKQLVSATARTGGPYDRERFDCVR